MGKRGKKGEKKGGGKEKGGEKIASMIRTRDLVIALTTPPLSKANINSLA